MYVNEMVIRSMHLTLQCRTTPLPMIIIITIIITAFETIECTDPNHQFNSRQMRGSGGYKYYNTHTHTRTPTHSHTHTHVCYIC